MLLEMLLPYRHPSRWGRSRPMLPGTASLDRDDHSTSEATPVVQCELLPHLQDGCHNRCDQNSDGSWTECYGGDERERPTVMLQKTIKCCSSGQNYKPWKPKLSDRLYGLRRAVPNLPASGSLWPILRVCGKILSVVLIHREDGNLVNDLEFEAVVDESVGFLRVVREQAIFESFRSFI